MPCALLEVENLRFAYPGTPPILSGVSFSLAQGENIELAGVNGSGKTTLFRCLTGLEKNWSGSIRLNGALISSEGDFQRLRRQVGYSLQNAEDQLFFPSVIEDVCFGPINLGLNELQAKERALETLDSLGIAYLADSFSFRLSGGQQKLVALAAVLAMRPDALLLDEPLNGLDAAAAKRLHDVLAGLGCAKIIVTHDTAFFRRICSQTFSLRDGRLVAEAL